MKRDTKLRRALVHLHREQPDPIRSQQAIESTRQAIRDRRMNEAPSSSRYAAKRQAIAVAVLCGLLLVMAWFAGINSNDNLAFAEVVKRVGQARSVKYVELNWAVNNDGYRGPKTETTVYISGRYLERVERRQVSEGDELPEGQHWVRQPEHYITISDLEKGIYVNLFPKEKLYSRNDTVMGLSQDGMMFIERRVKPRPGADLHASMSNVPFDKAEKIPSRRIDDRLVFGYRITEKIEKEDGIDYWERIYWVDPDTKLPVRIEVSHNSTRPRTASSRWIQRDIEFNVDLDKTLFSTEIPPGYTDKSREE